MSDIKALETLHTALIDSRKGYDEAISDETSPALKALFKEVQALHAAAHVDVHRMLDERNSTPDEGGSLMAKVHETVISVRAAIAGLGLGSLGAFADGEEHNLPKYDAAVQEAAGDRAAAIVLERHRGELAAMIGRLRAAST